MILRGKKILYSAFLLLACACAFFSFYSGTSSKTSGLLAGILLGLAEFLFLSWSAGKIGKDMGHFLRNYFLQAFFIRFPAIGLGFFALFYLLKMSPLALLAGFGAGLFLGGAYVFIRMNEAISKSQGSE